MKSRLWFVLTLLFVLSSVNFVHAEQPEAEKYRQILASGNFYIEYRVSVDEHNESIIKLLEHNKDLVSALKEGYEDGGLLVAQNGRRMKKRIITYGILGQRTIPDIYYVDDKYFMFTSSDEAILATEDDLKNLRIKLNGDWDMYKSKLNMLEPLLPLALKDRYSGSIPEPKWIESGSGGTEEQKLPYDKYQSTVYSAAGTVLYDYFFYIYYRDGNIDSAMLYWQEPGKQEKFYRGIRKVTITGEIPAKHIVMPKGCKVYQAGRGDMDDLLGNKVLLYKVGEEATK